jgi:hypothetical protein
VPFPNLASFGLSPELKPLYRLIWRADGELQALTASDDYRTVSSLPMSAGNVSTTASAVTFNPSGNISSTTVQTAIEELDTEKASTALASTSANGLAPQATAPASGLYNYLGITNGETAYTNKALFDATVPSTQAFGDSAATGSAAIAARRDHVHAMPANPVTSAATGFTITSGTTPKTLTVSDTASVTGTNTGDNATNSSSTYIGTTAVALNRASAALTLAGITLTTPDIGTPSAGTLTNCTGLPATGLVADTTTAIGVGSIELGHASDTSITRVSAGVVAIEGSNIIKENTTKQQVRLTASGAQSIGTTLVAVAFDTETFDTDSMHAAGDNTKITFTTAGTYLVMGSVTTDANAAAQAGIRLGGTTYLGKVAVGNAAASVANGAHISLIYTFTAGQYVELMGWFGTTQNTKSGVDGVFFSAVRLGA